MAAPCYNGASNVPSPTAQMFVNLARERDRAELRQSYVKFPGPLGVELGQPNQAAQRALETEKLTDEEYALRLGVEPPVTEAGRPSRSFNSRLRFDNGNGRVALHRRERTSRHGRQGTCVVVYHVPGQEAVKACRVQEPSP